MVVQPECVCAGTGGRVPTWRMIPGSSTESLALDVALQCRVPFDVVHRAAHLFKVGICCPHLCQTLMACIVWGQQGVALYVVKSQQV